ncbi:SIR2 family NAD-dependent protein deacylase [Actinomadura rupiterrae]|uniref:SIR2 family NAD-dependent protein deacylase n=1 Tax=Actinomadura rupiterrae TaxID=559627 RepID=UPI0020A4B179|nr:Sir2 family NAD-dependent protein deacetylase [Actinomadura rupiterrae]MCP2341521.1 NAD-dependent deacetylase [Actinomadura rupiterrae]
MDLPDWSRGVSRVAVLTGAGISTDSGIPDYRGADGVWTKNPELLGLFNRKAFFADADVRRRFWAALSVLDGRDAEPNAAHLALAELEAAGLAVRILTQNVDGLHQRAGSTQRKVLELHGSMATTHCTRCGSETLTAEVLSRGEDDPACTACGGILQPSIVLFGQFLDQDLLGKAANIARAAQLFIAIGSSLLVEPAAGLCRVAVEAGARLVIVNRDSTPYDDLATEVIREPIGVAVPALCAAIAASHRVLD